MRRPIEAQREAHEAGTTFGAVAAIVLLVASPAGAGSTKGPTLKSLQAQIKSLQKQVKTLKKRGVATRASRG